MAKVAIVILNWNGQAMLAKYLPNVIEYSRQDAEVWVADNCSSDQSMRLLETQFPQVKTIVLEQNFGFAEGYNRALKQIEAEYYILLNSDVEVSHHWLTPLIEFMDSHPQVAACQPKLLAEYDKDSFEYAGACGGFLDKYGYPFCLRSSSKSARQTLKALRALKTALKSPQFLPKMSISKAAR
jgi:GT2 family glycosyltransferase